MLDNFANILGKFSNPAPYFLALLFLFLIVFIYGISAGRGRMILMLLSLYAAIVLSALFPYRLYLSQNIKAGQPYFIELGLFLVSFFVVLLLILNSPLRSLAVRSRSPIFQILILSVLILGILVSHLTGLLPAEITVKLDHPVFTYFKSTAAQFWWALAGMVFLGLLQRRGE